MKLAGTGWALRPPGAQALGRFLGADGGPLQHLHAGPQRLWGLVDLRHGCLGHRRASGDHDGAGASGRNLRLPQALSSPQPTAATNPSAASEEVGVRTAAQAGPLWRFRTWQKMMIPPAASVWRVATNHYPQG